MFDLLKG